LALNNINAKTLSIAIHSGFYLEEKAVIYKAFENWRIEELVLIDAKNDKMAS
jgi:hypothetical protein